MTQVQSKLTPGLAKVIKTTLEFIKQNLITKIELEYAQIAASHVIDKLKETADILADNNPDNRTQLKLVWGGFIGDSAIIESVRLALLDAISKIKDPTVKEGLTLLLDPLTKTLVAVSDSDTNDGDQLEKIWLDFARSQEFVDFVQKNLKPILSKFIKQEFVVDLIISLLDLFVKEEN